MKLLILSDVFLLSNDISFLIDQEVLIVKMLSHIDSMLQLSILYLKIYNFQRRAFNAKQPD